MPTLGSSVRSSNALWANALPSALRRFVRRGKARKLEVAVNARDVRTLVHEAPCLNSIGSKNNSFT